MYLPWPQSAIMLLPSCRELVDSTGRLVFRGPRIKMGVCECSLLYCTACSCVCVVCEECPSAAKLLPHHSLLTTLVLRVTPAEGW